MLRTIFVASILWGLAFFATAGRCLAGASDQFELAQNREKDGYYRQAESIYQKIASDHNDTDEALGAQKNLSLLYVKMDSFGKFSRALAGLIEDFSEHPRLLDALHDVVRRYRYGSLTGRPGNSVEAWCTHQQIQRYVSDPNAGEGLFAVRAMNAMILIELEAAVGATAIDMLITDFSEHRDLPRAMWYIAERYKGLQEYKRAKSIYEAIAANSPDSDWALKAEPAIPTMDILPLIKSRDDVKARAAIEDLIADFKDHPGLPGSIQCIAAEYEESEEYKQARDLYLTITTAYPDTDHALTSLRNLAIVYFLMAEDAEARKVLDELIGDFSEHAALPETFYYIAEKCEGAGKFEQASGVYQQTAERFGDGPQAGAARLDAAETNILFLIQSGQDDEAHQAIDALTTDFSGYPGLLRALDHIGGRYEVVDKPEHTIAVWEKIIEIAPGSERAAIAQRAIGWTYHRTGEFDRAIEEYRKVPEDYPESVYCGSSQYWIGQSFLKKRDYEQALKAYDEAFFMYPDSRSAVYSQIKMALIYSRLHLYDEAIRDRRGIVEDYPDSGWAPYEQCGVAQTYWYRGDYGQAIKEYQRVIELYPDSKAAGHAARTIARLRKYRTK